MRRREENRPAEAIVDFVGEFAVDVAALVAEETLLVVFAGGPKGRNERNYNEG